MTELVVKIEDATLASKIIQAIKLLKGVVTVTVKQDKNELDKSVEAIEKGDIKSFDSVSDMMNYLNS